MSRQKLVLITRDEGLADVVQEALKNSDFEVSTDCRSMIEAANVMERVAPDGLLVDLDIPDLKANFLLNSPIRLKRVLFMLSSNQGRYEDLLRMKELVFVRKNRLIDEISSALARFASVLKTHDINTPREWVTLLTNRQLSRSPRLAIRIDRHFRVIDQEEICSLEFAENGKALITTVLGSYSTDEAAPKVAARLDKSRFIAIRGKVFLNIVHVKQITVDPVERCCSVVLQNERCYRAAYSTGGKLERMLRAVLNDRSHRRASRRPRTNSVRVPTGPK